MAISKAIILDSSNATCRDTAVRFPFCLSITFSIAAFCIPQLYPVFVAPDYLLSLRTLCSKKLLKDFNQITSKQEGSKESENIAGHNVQSDHIRALVCISSYAMLITIVSELLTVVH